jgi:hypothetical protein
MAKKNVPSNKGYDPYNKPTASKPKPKPNPYKASPNNPYNNAGPKVKASSSAKTKSVARAASRASTRSAALNTPRNSMYGDRGGMRHLSTDPSVEATKGMRAKNVAKKATADAARRARPSKIGWAKAGGPKAGGVKGLGTASRPGGAMVKWGGISAKKAAPQMLGGYLKGLASTAGAAVGRSLGPIGAVVGAGQVGYEIGKAANKKWNISGRIVDAVSPSYNPNSTGRSRTLTKSGSYDNPALQRHHAKKKKR